MLRLLIVLAVLAATIYAFVDCAQTDEYQVRGLPKPAWLVVVLVPVAGALAWFFAGRPVRPAPPRGPRPPLGPDDDPDFLGRL